MRFLEKFPITLSVDHLIFSVWLDSSSWEAIELREFLATGHEVLFINDIHIEPRIVIIDIFINTLLILYMHFI
jgi:hypothetical protein